MAALGYSENVYNGLEPHCGIEERIIRLAEVSMARYGVHILPVFEDPERHRHLRGPGRSEGEYMRMARPKGQYGFSPLMDCVRAAGDDRGAVAKDEELTIEDCVPSYRLVERQAALALKRPFRSLCVLLGTLASHAGLDVTPHNFTPLKLFLEHMAMLSLLRRGCGFEEQAKAKAEAEEQENDIVKSWRQSLLWQLRRAIMEDQRNFADSRKEQRSAQDKSATQEKEKSTAKEKDKASGKNDEAPAARRGKNPEKLPRLLYYPTTAATINAVHATLTSGDGLSDPRRCCVLINQPFGLEHLDELAEDAGEKFHPVCAAEIYDDYFRQVRIWTRMGHSAAVIQRELDQRFEPVRDVLGAIAASNQTSTSPNSEQ
ncbi:hypothetical protein GQ600_20700 [Phytophthora cactorum]|nr:hypothetical protein GQ600_20700 [Phytophthora cactorum]